jgi:hypothetical protein
MHFARIRRRSGRPDIERTAQILVDRLGGGAFDHAARQVAVLHLADRRDRAEEWRAIAHEIERLTGVRHLNGQRVARPAPQETAPEGAVSAAQSLARGP